jgi:hypothetical protein
MKEVLLVGVLAALAIAYITALHLLGKGRGRRLRDHLRATDGAAVLDEATGTVTARVHGFRVDCRLTSRGSGRDKVSWTEADAHVQRGELEVHMRPQRRDDTPDIRRGRLVDVEVGNSAFDELYLVEAAPADTARRLLTPELQRALVELRPDEVESTPFGLRIALRGWVEEPARVCRLVALAGSLAAAVAPALQGTLEALVPPPESAYRGASTSPEDIARWEAEKAEAARAQHAETEHLRRLRRDHKIRTRLYQVVWVLAALAATLVISRMFH